MSEVQPQQLKNQFMVQDQMSCRFQLTVIREKTQNGSAFCPRNHKQCGRICPQRSETCPYGLRRRIRCPTKYGDAIKHRPDMLAATCDPDTPVSAEHWQNFPKPSAERFLRNAAVLPDWQPSPRSQGAPTRRASDQPRTEPLVIHGYTVPEYQQAYRSTVGPLLRAPCRGAAAPAYSLELGRAVKERLFQELAYPTLHVLEGPGGRLEVVERFCVLRPAPHIALDVKGEPPCHLAKYDP